MRLEDYNFHDNGIYITKNGVPYKVFYEGDGANNKVFIHPLGGSDYGETISEEMWIRFFSKDYFIGIESEVDNSEILTYIKQIEEVVNTLKEIGSQDNRSTRFPIYYQIASDYKTYCESGYGEETVYLSQDGEQEFDSRDDAWAWYTEGMDTSDVYPEVIEEDFEKWFNDFTERDVKFETRYEGFFLIESEAESHLKSNRYHYGNNARTYAQHIWRAPQTENLISTMMQMYGISRSY